MKEDKKLRNEALRQIPAVNTLLDYETARKLICVHSRATVLKIIQEHLGAHRCRIAESESDWPEFSVVDFFDGVKLTLEERNLARFQPVINGTGVLIHTNLGRSPLAREALLAMMETASGYTNLELDLATGQRGKRGGQTEDLLCHLTGAEAAVIVNNCAAAVWIALHTLARGGEVIISRGEQVEIGGAFRMPDVIRQSEAQVVEVGTTNKTRLSDYAEAITNATKVILKVHPSNFRVIGFTHEAALKDVVELGHAHGLVVMRDLGSGALVDFRRFGMPYEPTVGETIAAGVDVVMFSGDKLMGGPQCGILVGKRDLIAQIGRNPLFRALRADKMSLVALEATLRLYLDPDTLSETLPLFRMLCLSQEGLLRRARRLRLGLSKIAGLTATIADGVGYTGGGTMPEAAIPSKQVRVRMEHHSAATISETLRKNQPAILGMCIADDYVIDLRTVEDAQISTIITAFRRMAI